MKSTPENHSCSLSSPVAITGLGAVCSLGNSLREISRGVASGKSGMSEIQGFDAVRFGCKAAPVQDPQVVKTDIPPGLAKTMGKHLSLLMIAIEQALGDAGIGSGMFAPEEMAFFAGMGTVDYHLEDLLPAVLKSISQNGELDYKRFFSTGYQEIYPLWPLGMLNNIAFCQAAIHFGFRGENSVFSPHGDAGIKAVAEAVKILSEGKAEVAFAGGVSEEISLLSLARARLKGLIGPPEDETGDQSAPGATDGVFLGECGAVVVLEPLSGAIKRGANILARVTGFGFSCRRDVKGNFASVQAISSAMEGALSQAGINREQIDLIMLGGSSQNELDAVRELFEIDGKPVMAVSTAKALGEMFAGGPIMNMAIALDIPDWATLPKNICPYPPRRTGQSVDPSGTILVNGISYEGMCASMVIERTAPGETL